MKAIFDVEIPEGYDPEELDENGYAVARMIEPGDTYVSNGNGPPKVVHKAGGYTPDYVRVPVLKKKTYADKMREWAPELMKGMWVATDQGGVTFLYAKEPVRLHHTWDSPGPILGVNKLVKLFSLPDPPKCDVDWKESKVQL